MAALTTMSPVDTAGFDDFVRETGPALWRSAWWLVGDRHLAEDLVQTALAKCLRHYDRVSATGSFEAYVRTAMYRTYASWWRRKWRAEISTAEPPASAAADPDSVARLDTLRALARLPRGQRACVVLRYFDDLTERQTAELLGISVGTVKSQTSRGLAALRSSPEFANRAEDEG